MEKNIPNTNTTNSDNTQVRNDTGNPLLTQRKLTAQELEKKNAEIAADIKAEKNRAKLVFDTSRFFEFTLGETYQIELDPALTRVDNEYVYSKVKRNPDGSLVRGPNGELYNPDNGEVLMSKFKDKNGKLKPVKPAKRYIYYGWHVGNKEEQATPLRLTLNADYAANIQNYIAHTRIFEITKQISDSKYSIVAMLSGAAPPQQQEDDHEQQEEPTPEEQEEALQAQRDYEASRGQY